MGINRVILVTHDITILAVNTIKIYVLCFFPVNYELAYILQSHLFIWC
jgi:hypothetical protein